MEKTAQAGQGSVPGRGLLEWLPCRSNAPTCMGKEPSLSQDSATSFPTGKCLRGWEGAGSERSDLPSPGSPHVWVEADARSWSGEDAWGWGSCQICVSCLQYEAVAILGGRALLWGHHTAHSPRRSPL